MRSLTNFTFIVVMTIMFSSYVFAENEFVKNSEVKIPQQTSKSLQLSGETDAENMKLIDNFKNQHGNWNFIFDKFTGTPHRAFGTPLKIEGYPAINKGNVKDAALQFVNQYEEILMVNPADLEISSIRNAGEKWYVSFYQVHKNIPVMFSEVELRMHTNGNVFAFGSEFYNDISINTNQSVSYEDASKTAVSGISSNKVNIDRPLSAPQKFILPLKSGNEIDYRLVYQYDVRSEEPFGIFKTYVDAHKNEIVWRYSTIDHLSGKLKFRGTVNMESANDTPEEVGMPNQYFQVGDDVYTTDENGDLEIDFDQTENVSAKLQGKWARVFSSDRADAIYSGQVQPGQENIINWDDASHLFERITYYHANVVYNYIKNIDPSADMIDRQVTYIINWNSSMTNAFSQGDTIQFLNANDGEMRLPASPTVLYHEYTHSVNKFMYTAFGRENGMINASCNEGTADLMSALILDEPLMGRGVWASNEFRYMRKLDNTVIYPDSMTGESHYDGQALSGAFWDIRKETSIEYVANLSHFAKYGTPDDPSTGVAFMEWFIETLITDDDDGNLSNGTPHMELIVRSFNRHGIGTSLLLRANLVHEPYPDTKDLQNPYLIDFEMDGYDQQSSLFEDLSVIYSIDNFESVNTIPAVNQSGNDFRAEIPAHPRGTIMNYYFSATDKITDDQIFFTNDMIATKPYTFLIGYDLVKEDTYETDNGWSVDSSLKVSGRSWERAVPTAFALQTMILQPGKDHTENGTVCWVTGAENDPRNLFNEIMIGQTDLISPVYDLTVYEKPVMRFYYWMSIIHLASQSTEPEISVEISSNGGQTWEQALVINTATNDWKRELVVIENYIESTDNFRVKFSLVNTGQGMVFPALCEALIDDFQIYSIGEANSVDENEFSDAFISVYPNPFSSNSTIIIEPAEAGNISAKIYDVYGNVVANLIDSNISGVQQLDWNGTSMDGNPVSAGMYFLRVNINGKIHSETIIKN